MRRLSFSAAIFLFLAAVPGLAAYGDADWREGVAIPPGGRSNPYGLMGEEHASAVRAGKLHTQIYPVEISGALPPLRPIVEFLDSEDRGNILREFLRTVFSGFSSIRSFDDILKWLGLHPYPKESDTGVYSVPYPHGQRPDYRMGLGMIDTDNGLAFTFSCVACHSSNLFGKTVLGLANRFPRANDVFVKASNILPLTSSHFFKWSSGATEGERRLYKRTKKNVAAVGAKIPRAFGLDTSLAQVALSLAKRDPDAYATKNIDFQFEPRDEMLSHFVADSKPAVWWNLKYKNRWLSDGSIVSGNPVVTNILWNEVGRGSDLMELESWIDRNEQKIKELTTAVFSVEPPRFTDFFPVNRINLELARRGETIFENRCAKCHGHYEKGWSQPNAAELSLEDQLKTFQVRYPEQTKVHDVGTDPGRYQGMKSLEQLNNLSISKRFGVTVRTQKGYVPPPLVGIWARWPYFHNNSVPNLCALLTRSKDRPKVFFTGEAEDKERDFDAACNGYPVGKDTPEEWKTRKHRFDTRKDGLGNMGHDERIFLKDGVELLTPDDKHALVQFLQTL